MRGEKAEIGTVRVAQNGYRYVKTERGWRLLHHVIAEKKLGRPLRPDERVSFIDGNRANIDPSNLEVSVSETRKRKIHRLMLKIDRLERALAEVKTSLAELAGEGDSSAQRDISERSIE